MAHILLLLVKTSKMIDRNILWITLTLSAVAILPRLIKGSKVDYNLLVLYFFYISICFTGFYAINQLVWRTKPAVIYQVKFILAFVLGLLCLGFFHLILQAFRPDWILFFFNLKEITALDILIITLFRTVIIQSVAFVCLLFFENKREQAKLQDDIAHLNQYLDDLRNHRINEKEYKNTVLLRFQDKVLPVEVSEIAFFHLDEGIVVLYLFSGRKYFQNSSLENLEKELNPQLFFRANRQFLVHRKAVEKIEQIEHRKLKIILTQTTKEEVIISKVKATSFLRWLEN